MWVQGRASPSLLGPECRTPRQMHLANGLCRFVELARVDRAHSRFPGHALTPTGVMAIRCKEFHLPDL